MSYIHIKICGITNITDARVAVEAGADLLGFILYPRSPRYVEPGVIREIIEEIKEIGEIGEIGDRRLEIGTGDQSPISPISNLPYFIGVFVNEPISRVSEILAKTGLDYAQLHGDETPGMVAELAGRGFKALRPADADSAASMAARYARLGPQDNQAPRWLVDAYDPREYGGTGKRADWHVAATLARRYPGLLLAGGLTPDNVAAAIRTVQPWGVDVSSGVELSPGRKDHAKVRAFVRNVHEACGKG